MSNPQDQPGSGGGGGGIVVPPVHGLWYSGVNSTGAGAALVLVNEPQYVPFMATAQYTWLGIGFHVTAAAAGSTCRLAIYADNGAGYPGALVLDAGEVAVTAIGDAIIAISQALAPGLYWLGIVPHGSGVCSVTGAIAAGPACLDPCGGGNTPAQTPTNLGCAIIGPSGTVAGAWPATAPIGGGYLGSALGMPWVGLKA